MSDTFDTQTTTQTTGKTALILDNDRLYCNIYIFYLNIHEKIDTNKWKFSILVFTI